MKFIHDYFFPFFFLFVHSTAFHLPLYSEDCEKFTREVPGKENGVLIFRPDKPWDLAFVIDAGAEVDDPFKHTNFTAEMVRYNNFLTSACLRGNVILPNEEIPSLHSELYENGTKSGWQFTTDMVVIKAPNGKLLEFTDNTRIEIGPLELEWFCLDIEYGLMPPTGTQKHHNQTINLEVDSLERIPFASYKFPIKPGFMTVRLLDRLPYGATNVFLVLSVSHVNFMGIRKIYGCNPHAPEVRTVLEKNVTSFPPQLSKLPDSKCHNGGSMSSKGHCDCPVGFGGNVCQKACGPRKWGPDCDRYCSDTNLGCRSMLFCKYPYEYCQCATGYTGYMCNTPCNSTSWGADCSLKCGKCLSQAGCDPYTGACPMGCQPGYIQPHCTKKSAHLITPPKVEPGYKDALVSANISAATTSGYFNPTYFVVQYKEEDKETWGKPKQVTIINLNGTAIYSLKGLTPGTIYSVRVVLLTEDFNSFLDDSLPSTTFRTLCDVNAKLHLTAHIIKDSVALMWKRLEGTLDDDTECRLETSEVQMRSTSKWVSKIVWRPEDVVMPLVPGLTYYARVRHIETHVKGNFSNTVTFKYTENEGTVLNLRTESVTNTSATIVWEALYDTEKNFTVFWNCMGVMSSEEGISCMDDANWLNTDSTNFTITDLKPFRKYLVRVKHNPGSGYNQRMFTTQPSVPDEAPTGGEVEYVDGGISVTWTKPTRCLHCNGVIIGFRYFLKDSNSTLDNEIEGYVGSSEEPNLLLPMTDQRPGASYQLRIYLVNIAGVNPNRPLIINFKIPTAEPRKVTVLRVTENSALVEWQPPGLRSGNITSYKVLLEQGNRVQYTAEQLATEYNESEERGRYYSIELKGLTPGLEYTVRLEPVTLSNITYAAAEKKFCSRPPSTWSASAPLPSTLRLYNLTDAVDLIWLKPSIEGGPSANGDDVWKVRGTYVVLVASNDTAAFDLDDVYVRSEDRGDCIRRYKDEYLEGVFTREFGSNFFIVAEYDSGEEIIVVGERGAGTAMNVVVEENCELQLMDNSYILALAEVRDSCGLLSAAVIKTDTFVP